MFQTISISIMSKLSLSSWASLRQQFLHRFTEAWSGFWSEWSRRKPPRYLLGALCLNLLLAPAVQAATDNAVTRGQAYALGVLVLVTVALSIYLFAVMFQPEKF